MNEKNIINKVVLIFVFMLSLITAKQAAALDWIWAGEAPWVYNQEDGEWYYMSSFDSAVWLFGQSEAIELAPAQGFSPASVLGQTLTLQTPLGSTSFQFQADGRYRESFGEDVVTGDYHYAKTGNNTALLTLLSDNNGAIVVVTIDFSSVSEGSLSGRATDVFETNEVSGTFTLQ